MFGIAAGLFTAWRSFTSTALALLLTVVASFLVVLDEPACMTILPPLGNILLPLEGYGILTLVLAPAPGERRPSRRLVGAWAASSGLLLFGLAHRILAPALGSALIMVALGHRLGAFPAFGWAPLMLRHPRSFVSALGAIGFAATLAVAAMARHRVPDPESARAGMTMMAAVAIPYALYHLRRQWRVDRRCARSYLAALAASVVLLLLGIA